MESINIQVAQLHLLRLMGVYGLSVDAAVDKLLNDYHNEMDIGNIILAGGELKKLL